MRLKLSLEVIRKIVGISAGILIVSGFLLAFVGWEGAGLIMVLLGAIVTGGLIDSTCYFTTY